MASRATVAAAALPQLCQLGINLVGRRGGNLGHELVKGGKHSAALLGPKAVGTLTVVADCIADDSALGTAEALRGLAQAGDRLGVEGERGFS